MKGRNKTKQARNIKRYTKRPRELLTSYKQRKREGRIGEECVGNVKEEEFVMDSLRGERDNGGEDEEVKVMKRLR